MWPGAEEGKNEEKESQILYFVSLWRYGCKFSIIAVLYFENMLSHPEHKSFWNDVKVTKSTLVVHTAVTL